MSLSLVFYTSTGLQQNFKKHGFINLCTKGQAWNYCSINKCTFKTVYKMFYYLFFHRNFNSLANMNADCIQIKTFNNITANL